MDENSNGFELARGGDEGAIAHARLAGLREASSLSWRLAQRRAQLGRRRNPCAEDLLVRLRANGLNVWGEIYPYAAGQTTINAAFARPENWIDTMYEQFKTKTIGKKKLKHCISKVKILYEQICCFLCADEAHFIDNACHLPIIVLCGSETPAKGTKDRKRCIRGVYNEKLAHPFDYCQIAGVWELHG